MDRLTFLLSIHMIWHCSLFTPQEVCEKEYSCALHICSDVLLCNFARQMQCGSLMVRNHIMCQSNRYQRSQIFTQGLGPLFFLSIFKLIKYLCIKNLCNALNNVILFQGVQLLGFYVNTQTKILYMNPIFGKKRRFTNHHFGK